MNEEKRKKILTIPPPRHRRKIQKFPRFRSNHILQQLMHMNFGIPYNLLFILLLLPILPNIILLTPTILAYPIRPSRPRMIKTPNRQRRKKQHPRMMEGIDDNPISLSFFSFSFSSCFSFRRRRRRRKGRKIRFIKNKSCMPSGLG